MFCEKCGKQIADDSAFCDGCGAKVESIETPQAQPVALLPLLTPWKPGGRDG